MIAAVAVAVIAAAVIAVVTQHRRWDRHVAAALALANSVSEPPRRPGTLPMECELCGAVIELTMGLRKATYHGVDLLEIGILNSEAMSEHEDFHGLRRETLRWSGDGS